MDGSALDRARGCLIGQIAGDALGSRVEFRRSKEISDEFRNGVRDLVDGGEWNIIAGQPTDDSEMALALARMLVRRGRYDRWDAKNAYRAWLHSDPFDIGETVRRGLQRCRDRNSQANGAMMRISPLGVFGAKHDLADVAEWAEQDAAVTHPHPVCRKANALYTMAIAHSIRSGCEARGLYERIAAWADDMKAEDMDGKPGTPAYGAKEYEEANETIQKEIVGAAESLPVVADSGHRGWVLIAFRNALWQLLHARNLEEAIVDTVGLGGDADTNAAICGALFGAVSGLTAIPARWSNTVLNCRPEAGKPHVHRPRPEWCWPVDALELAERLAG